MEKAKTLAKYIDEEVYIVDEGKAGFTLATTRGLREPEREGNSPVAWRDASERYFLRPVAFQQWAWEEAGQGYPGYSGRGR